MELIPTLPEGQYAALPNGQTIHYLDTGKGPVVVFLHGSGSGASGYSNFKHNYPIFAENTLRTLVIDLIGYGYSDKPDDVDYHINFFAQCVVQTLNSLHINECVIVGNSLGGAIAIRLALDFPERVKKLVLMAPGGIEEQGTYFTMPGMQAMKALFMSDNVITSDAMKTFFEQVFVVNPDCIDATLVEERWQSMQSQSTHVLKTMLVPNMADELEYLNCPVLAFWGMNDTLMPESGIMTLAKKCKKIRVVLLSECGHWVMLERKDLFNKTAIDFIKNN